MSLQATRPIASRVGRTERQVFGRLGVVKICAARIGARTLALQKVFADDSGASEIRSDCDGLGCLGGDNHVGEVALVCCQGGFKPAVRAVHLETLGQVAAGLVTLDDGFTDGGSFGKFRIVDVFAPITGAATPTYSPQKVGADLGGPVLSGLYHHVRIVHRQSCIVPRVRRVDLEAKG